VDIAIGIKAILTRSIKVVTMKEARAMHLAEEFVRNYRLLEGAMSMCRHLFNDLHKKVKLEIRPQKQR